jgi:DNA-binding transcriptional LysR family regulator
MRQPNDLSLSFFLLKCLVALVEQSHVTRASDLLSMSQPAMSRAISQLRQLTGDPILVKGKGGLVPTAKALQLRDFAVRILSQMDQLLGHAITFDPDSVRRTFRVVATDYLECVFLDPVTTRLTQEYPSLGVSVQHPINPKDLLKVLESGEVDCCIGMLPSTLEELRHRLIFRDRIVCIAAHSHPAVGKPLTPKDFAALEHVVIRPTVNVFGAVVDEKLAESDLVRKQRVLTPNYLSVPFLIESTGLVALIPESLADKFDVHFKLARLSLPFEVPSYGVFLYWHERNHHFLDHIWFRNQLMEGQ